MQPTKLLLWDIDGTIIATKGAGEAAMDMAMKDVFGIEADLHAIDYSGRTDPLLGRMLCKHYGVPDTPEKNQAFVDAYVRNLTEILAASPATLLPGMEVLGILTQRKDCLQGLLTGNVRAGGKVKLESVDAWQYFKFGSFADNCFNRNELAPKALEVARDDFGVAFTPQQVFVIGDTPRDIECGRHIHARTVAVATGKYPVQKLAEAEPDYLFENLSDTGVFLAILDEVDATTI